ncbi:MAG: hypothetical protein H6927_08840 [Burkholderiaceae bacterium]|nr:hypothetical protein [Burkholderiaceae bacterium]MCP5218202.1 hypothetical protein [Burkholderiaceae bacterium]
MLRQRLMWIAWPAFMVAGVLEVMVFAVLDPLSLTLFGQTVDWPREAIYSVTFFIFWVMLMLSSGITLMLARPARDLNGFERREVVQPPENWTPPDILK